MLYDKATISIVLDRRRQKKGNLYPVKLRVTYKGQPRYYATGYDLTDIGFDRVMGERPRGETKDIRNSLELRAARARSIADGLAAFSFSAFRDELKGTAKKVREKSVQKPVSHFYEIFGSYIKGLRQSGQYGTATSYSNALSSLQMFSPTDNPINAITSQYFERYEAWMKSRGRADATIGMYLRAARAVINHAIDTGEMEQNRYPFGKGGYRPPVGTNTKKALTMDEVKRLATYEPQSEQESLYRDFWILSYLCNGANMIDILTLTADNIRGNVIVFRRHKTKRTKRGNPKPVVITYSSQVRDIVERWGYPASDGYIFPFIEIGWAEDVVLKKTKLFIKQVNKYINKIARSVDINQHITTYTARHTYATVMKRAGVPISFISDSLGHSNVSVTERYLAGFEDGYRAEVTKALTDW